jgi:hypothetical protein
MRLREFVSGNTISTAGFQKSVGETVKMLSKQGLYLTRYGGPNRVLQNAEDPRELVAIFAVNDGHMIGLSAGSVHGFAGISKVYVWKTFDGPWAPDFTIELPVDISSKYFIKMLVRQIQNPKPGEYDLNLKESRVISEMAKRTSVREFLQMAKEFIAQHDDTGLMEVDRLSWAEIERIAAAFDVQVPGEIRRNYSPHRTSYWNLSRELAPGERALTPEEEAARQREHDDVAGAAGAEGGGDVDDDYNPETDEEDPEIRDRATRLRGMQRDMDLLGKLNEKGRLIVTGIKDGKFFSIKKLGVDVGASINAIQMMLDRQLQLGLDDGDDGDMEEQMDEMKAYVGGIISGTSQTAHSVILTGAPGVGKSYTVMGEIENRYGLKEGKDFVVIQGGTTTTKLFERLFVSYDKLIVFDDCDSMWKDPEAVNILKAALQTGGGVRAISRDKAGTIDTAKMSYEDRERELYLIRSFYDDPLYWAKEKLKKAFPQYSDFFDSLDSLDDPDIVNPYDKENKEERNDWQKFKSYFQNEILKALDAGRVKLPNKIHFEGRIIFISNLTEDQLDDAVRSRATIFNVSVTNNQVIDFVETIIDKFKHDHVDMETREDLLNFIREIYTTGVANEPFSIRNYQVCMDLVAMGGNWKKRVARKLK